MSLSPQRMQEIEEEEKYRASIRNSSPQSSSAVYQTKSKTPWYKPKGCLTWLVLIFVGIPMFVGVINGVSGNKGSKPSIPDTTATSKSSVDKPTIPSPIKYDSLGKWGVITLIKVEKGTSVDDINKLVNYFHALDIADNLTNITGNIKNIYIVDDPSIVDSSSFVNIVVTPKQSCKYIVGNYVVDPTNGNVYAGSGYYDGCSNFKPIFYNIPKEKGIIGSTTDDELHASVSYNNYLVKITNNDKFNWTACIVRLNSDYKYNGGEQYGLDAGQTTSLSFSDFTKGNGIRFNSYEIKPSQLSITCDSGYNTWNLE